MEQTEKSLTKVTLIYTAGNIASKLISFLLVFVITFYLSKEAVGEYDLILSTIALLSPFVSLQLSDAVLRWLLEDGSPVNTAKVYTNVFAMVGINLLIVSIVYWAIIPWTNINHTFPIYALFVVGVPLQIFHNSARAKGLNFAYAFSGIMYAIIYTAFTLAALIFLKMGLEGLLLSASAGTLGSILYLVVKINHGRYISKSYIDKKFAGQLVKYSLPLLPNVVSWWAISSANRYIIMAFLGVAANGIFAVSYKIPTILIVLTGIFYLAWQEKSIKAYNTKERDTYYSQVLKKYLRIVLSIVLVLTAVNKVALKYIVAPAFYESWKYTPLLLIAVIFQTLSSFYGVGYLTSKDTKGAFTTSLYGGLTTIGSSFLLIPVRVVWGRICNRFRLYGDVHRENVPDKKILHNNLSV